MKKRIAMCVIVCCLIPAVSVFAQGAAKKALSDSDLKKFLKDFKPMMADFEALGVEYESGSEAPGDVSDIIGALQANADVKRIVRRYGWNDEFFRKYGVILGGYVSLKMGEALAEMQAGIRESLASIEANPDLTRAQKDQLKAQMTSALSAYSGTGESADAYGESIHPDDLRLIEKYQGELDALFDVEEDYDDSGTEAVSGATGD